jgi:hypothetical protein
MCVGPNQDLFATQHGQAAGIADVPLFGEQLGKGRSAGQAAQAQAQAAVHVPPLLRENAGDGAGIEAGPRAGTGVVGVNPLQDFGYGEHMPKGFRLHFRT